MEHRGSRRGLRTNIVSLIAAVTIVGIARFATNWLVAWQYGPNEHGRFALVFQIVSMLLVVGEMGIITAFGVRQVALAATHRRNELNQLINNLSGTLLLVHILLGLIVFVLATGLGGWLHTDPKLLRLASIWLFGFGLYRLTWMVANGLEAMAYSVFTTLIFYGIWITWLAVCMVASTTLVELFTGWAVIVPVAGLACWLVMYPLLRQHELRWRPRFRSPKATLSTVISALPYSLPLMGTLVLPGIVCLLLAQWHDSNQISYFQICFSLGILAHLVALPMANAVLPTLTRLTSGSDSAKQNAEHASPDASASNDKAAHLVRRSFYLLAVLVSLAFCVYWPLGQTVLGLIADEYRYQVMVLRIIAAAVGFDACRLLVDQLLMTSNHMRTVAWIEVGRFIVLLISLCLGVPPWGALGAAAAVFLVGLANCLAKLIATHRLMGLNLWFEFGTLTGLLATTALAGWFINEWVAIPVWLATLLVLGSLRKRSTL